MTFNVSTSSWMYHSLPPSTQVVWPASEASEPQGKQGNTQFSEHKCVGIRGVAVACVSSHPVKLKVKKNKKKA